MELESGFEAIGLKRVIGSFRTMFSVGIILAALKLMILEVRNLSAIHILVVSLLLKGFLTLEVTRRGSGINDTSYSVTPSSCRGWLTYYRYYLVS
jgi:hypothetical protein